MVAIRKWWPSARTPEKSCLSREIAETRPFPPKKHAEEAQEAADAVVASSPPALGIGHWSIPWDLGLLPFSQLSTTLPLCNMHSKNPLHPLHPLQPASTLIKTDLPDPLHYPLRHPLQASNRPRGGIGKPLGWGEGEAFTHF